MNNSLLESVILNDNDEMVHPLGAQTARAIHAGLGVLAMPFYWLHSQALGLPKLQKKFDEIIDAPEDFSTERVRQIINDVEEWRRHYQN